MPDAPADKGAITNEVAAVLDKRLSHELIKTITAGQSAYFVIEEVGEHIGGLLLVRQVPGSQPEIVMADSSLAVPDGSLLPEEVTKELQALFGKPAPDDEEATPSVSALAASTPTATREHIAQRLFDEAHRQDGHLSSRNAPHTSGGVNACAWAVNLVATRALGRPIGGGLQVLAMRKVLVSRHIPVSEASAIPGTIIISCSPSGAGHVGIVGEAGSGGKGHTKVYSNSSSHALWMHNYTIDEWRADFRGFPVEFFELNPKYFSGDKAFKHPPYPGTPLRQGSQGEDVRTVQQRLNGLGSKLEVDGIFGPATHQAVVAFQKKAGLAADGIVGPQTWNALWSAH
jgi:hypothetical protein